MNFKKLFCILSRKHNKEFSIRYCGSFPLFDYKGYHTVCCYNCDTKSKRACLFEHCVCCNKHCELTISGISACKCLKCAIKRSLNISFFYEDKFAFIKQYQYYATTYDKAIISAAISDKVYDPIRDELNKYLILL